MSEQRFDRLFKWLDLLRIIVYAIGVSLVGGAIWCTKIQMTINDIEKQLEASQNNSSLHRDALQQKDKDNEHRFTSLEQWVKDHDLPQVRK